MATGKELMELASVVGSAQIVVKILGPTASYLGEGIKTWAENRINNLNNIFSNAEKKLGDKINDEGAVPPKVLKGILDEGSFCDDALAAEYFGGVLASSRSGVSRDDRGASFISLISRLSTYQVRAHYAFYSIFKKLFNDTKHNIGLGEGRSKMKIFIPYNNVFKKFMDFDEKEDAEIILQHIIFGLEKEILISPYYYFEVKEELQRHLNKVFPTTGLVINPSPLGVELYLWAHGKSKLNITEFLKSENEFKVDCKINIPEGCLIVDECPPANKKDLR